MRPQVPPTCQFAVRSKRFLIFIARRKIAAVLQNGASRLNLIYAWSRAPKSCRSYRLEP